MDPYHSQTSEQNDHSWVKVVNMFCSHTHLLTHSLTLMPWLKFRNCKLRNLHCLNVVFAETTKINILNGEEF